MLELSAVALRMCTCRLAGTPAAPDLAVTADRYTYVAYQSIESQKPKQQNANYVQEEGSPFGEVSSMCSETGVAACFNSVHTKKVVDYAWRPATDEKFLGVLGGVAHKKRGWFPYENGQAPVSHRAKAFRGLEPTLKVEDYLYRVSFILRQGTWWVVERAQDLRLDNKNLVIFKKKLRFWSPCSFLKRPPAR